MMRAMKRCAAGLVTLGVLATAATSYAAPASDGQVDKAELDRLDRQLGLARIWAEVKFFHPAMFQRAIDWDGALIKVLPEVDAASDAASYRAAIAHLLAAVGDPRTDVVPAATDGPPAAEWKTRAGNDVLVLNARLPSARDDYYATRRLARDVRPELAASRVLVVDLRGLDDDDDRLLEGILDDLPATQTWPSIASIAYQGFRSQGETNRDTYPTSWSTRSAGAPTRGTSAGPRHVVFAVDPRHTLPLEAVALWLAGHATLVSARPLDDSAAARTRRVPLPHGVVAQLRIGDVILPGGRGLSADVVVGRGEDVRARAIAIARSIAAGAAPPRGAERRSARSDDLRLVDDDDSPTTGLPSRERRVLAAFRAWAVIEYFHGTRRLDHDWDKQLLAVLPKLATVTDVQAYADALEEMLVPLYDGHSVVYRRGESRGSWTAIYWRQVEGKIVAGGLRDEAVAREAGIALGDELIRVDGVAAEAVVAGKQRTISSGNEEGRRQWAIGSVDRGLRGTTVDVEVRDSAGRSHHAALMRSYNYEDNFYAHPGPHHRILGGNVGYVNLTMLGSDEVDAMFAALGNTRAIVFDMRGYPKGTAWLIGARINSRATHALAEIRTPIVTAWNVGRDVTVRAIQRGLNTDRPVYHGKIVVLTDDRAVSAAEHLCLVFEATAGATFIGSPTFGTNGEETYVRMPGGFEMRFTGMEIFHADGRQLQQVGIQPAITVRPTLRGLRAGKDEVLDRALRYLQTGR